MSVITNNLLLGDEGYFLTKSLRFRSSASAYLNRTPASAGNRKTFTFSTWIKLGEIAASNGTIFSAGTSSGESTRFYLRYTGSQFQTGYGSNNLDTTVAVFRDPSAWYHLVLTVDTTQATAANRLKIYVNGVQQSVTTSVNFTQNVDTAVNNNVVHNICREAAISTGYVDGYLAEVNFIDGQALTPSSFGQTSPTTGVWIPKKYAGTYGTNGFYLPFTDVATTSGSNAGLGKDFSGNGNYWTTNNISVTSGSTYDSMKDVPTLTDTDTANYAVMNPLDKGTSITLAEANLSQSIGSAAWQTARATIAFPTTGKWYVEGLLKGSSGNGMIGIGTAQAGLNNYAGADAYGWSYNAGSGQKFNSGSGSAYGATYAPNDVIGVAFDADAGTLTFYKNNVSQGTAYSGLTSGQYYLMPSVNVSEWAINFGQRPFAYTPPTGFKALNTFNLPTPTIGATASTQANKYMDISLYSGTGAIQSITGLNFQPDFVWIKNRNNTAGHSLFDAVRGVSSSSAPFLQSQSTTNEADFNGTVGDRTLTSLNSNGFTLGADGLGLTVNGSSRTYVAWNWKANGSGSSNTAGSITSTVSANTTAGFSIATFTCPSSGNFTVGHGLGVAPAMFILKTRSAVDGWYVYHQSLATPASNYLVLNTTAATATSTSIWGNTNPTSTVLTLGTNAGIAANATGVLYCFAQVAGYSAFGSYTGNGSSDGPFVFLGFRPKFILIRRSDALCGWKIYNTSGLNYNPINTSIEANDSGAEATSTNFNSDWLSNGFKLRTTYADFNTSGGTYIYMAFAESPFKYSLGR